MSKRKEVIISVCILVAIVISAVPAVMLASSIGGFNRDSIIGLYAEEKNTLDMVYIGGSACATFWMPLKAWEDYGYTSYNYAASTLTPQSIKYLMDEASKTQSPKVWVVDLRPFQYGDIAYGGSIQTPNMYTEAPIRNVTDNLRYTALRNELIEVSILEPRDRLSYYFPFLRWHSNIIRCLQDVLFDYDEVSNLLVTSRRNPTKSFWGFSDIEELDFVDYSNETGITPLQGDVNDVFVDLMEYCKVRSEDVLFVVHSYMQSREDKQKYNYMEQVIEEYGFDYINMNDHYEEIGHDFSRDFYNESHTNIYGAEKYTAFLSKYIKETYSMPDHRLDTRYAAWTEDTIEFNKMIESMKKEKEE